MTAVIILFHVLMLAIIQFLAHQSGKMKARNELLKSMRHNMAERRESSQEIVDGYNMAVGDLLECFEATNPIIEKMFSAIEKKFRKEDAQ